MHTSSLFSDITSLIGEMKGYDADKRFMAASDLTTLVEGNTKMLDDKSCDNIVQAFLQQFEDSNIEVQGNAVKNLVKLANHLGMKQLTEIARSLSSLVRSSGPPVQDIHCTCLRSLIIELDATKIADLVRKTIIPEMLQGIAVPEHGSSNFQEKASHVRRDETTVEACTEVLLECFRRLNDGQDVDVETCQRHLLRHVFNPLSRMTIRKKAIGVLGELGRLLPPAALERLLSELLAYTDGGGGNAGNCSNRFTAITIISTIGSAVGPKMAAHIHRILPLLLSICEKSGRGMGSTTEATDPGEDISMDFNGNQSVEILESTLEALKALVTDCPQQMIEESDRLITICEDLAAFDPNAFDDEGCGDGGDAASEEGGDTALWEDDDDDPDAGYALSEADGDTSWRVRRAAYHVLSAAVLRIEAKRTSLTLRVARLLMRRWKEREEVVRLDILKVLESCLHHVSPRETFHSPCGGGLGGSGEGEELYSSHCPPGPEPRQCLSRASPKHSTSLPPSVSSIELSQSSTLRAQLIDLFTSSSLSALLAKEYGRQLHSSSGNAKLQHALVQAFQVFASAYPVQAYQSAPQWEAAGLFTEALLNSSSATRYDAIETISTFFRGHAILSERPSISDSAPLADADLWRLSRVLLSSVPRLTSDSFYKVAASTLVVIRRMCQCHLAHLLRHTSSECSLPTNCQSSPSMMTGSEVLTLLKVCRARIESAEGDREVRIEALQSTGYVAALASMVVETCQTESFPEEELIALKAEVEAALSAVRERLTASNVTTPISRDIAAAAMGSFSSLYSFPATEILVSDEQTTLCVAALQLGLTNHTRATVTHSLQALSVIIRSRGKTLASAVHAQCVEYVMERLVPDISLFEDSFDLLADILLSAGDGAKELLHQMWPRVLTFANGRIPEGRPLKSLLDFMVVASGVSRQDTSSSFLLTPELMEEGLRQYFRAQHQDPNHFDTSSNFVRRSTAITAQCCAKIALASVETSPSSPSSSFPDMLRVWVDRGSSLLSQISSIGDDMQVDSAVPAQDGRRLAMQDARECELLLITIGEFAREYDVSGLQEVPDLLLASLEAPLESLRLAGSLALGGATQGSVEFFLSFILKALHETDHTSIPSTSHRSADDEGHTLPNGHGHKGEKTEEKIQAKKHYLLLSAVRETLSHPLGAASAMASVRPIFPGSTENIESVVLSHVNSILEILVEYASSPDPADRGVVSDCLGELLAASSFHDIDVASTIMKAVEGKGKFLEGDPAYATLLDALKCAARKRCAPKIIRSMAGILFEGFQLPHPLPTRKAAFEALQIIASNAETSAGLLAYPSKDAEHNNEVLGDRKIMEEDRVMEAMAGASVMDPSLIREFDLGPFKHRVDEGEPLRRAAISACIACVHAYPLSFANDRVVEIAARAIADPENTVASSGGDLCSHLVDLCPISVGNHMADVAQSLEKTILKCVRLLESNKDGEEAGKVMINLSRVCMRLQHLPAPDTPREKMRKMCQQLPPLLSKFSLPH